MARTKQTARKSLTSFPPRKRFAIKRPAKMARKSRAKPRFAVKKATRKIWAKKRARMNEDEEEENVKTRRIRPSVSALNKIRPFHKLKENANYSKNTKDAKEKKKEDSIPPIIRESQFKAILKEIQFKEFKNMRFQSGALAFLKKAAQQHVYEFLLKDYQISLK
jgi:hypothetical protein